MDDALVLALWPFLTFLAIHKANLRLNTIEVGARMFELTFEPTEHYMYWETRSSSSLLRTQTKHVRISMSLTITFLHEIFLLATFRAPWYSDIRPCRGLKLKWLEIVQLAGDNLIVIKSPTLYWEKRSHSLSFHCVSAGYSLWWLKPETISKVNRWPRSKGRCSPVVLVNRFDGNKSAVSIWFQQNRWETLALRMFSKMKISWSWYYHSSIPRRFGAMASGIWIFRRVRRYFRRLWRLGPSLHRRWAYSGGWWHHLSLFSKYSPRSQKWTTFMWVPYTSRLSKPYSWNCKLCLSIML